VLTGVERSSLRGVLSFPVDIVLLMFSGFVLFLPETNVWVSDKLQSV